MMGTKERIWVTMFILSYPFINVSLSTSCIIAGKLDHLTSLGAVRLNCRPILAFDCLALLVWIAQIQVGDVPCSSNPVSQLWQGNRRRSA